MKFIQLFGGVILLLIGLVCLIWGNWPAANNSELLVRLSPQEISLPAGDDEIGLAPSPPHGYKVSLDSPAYLRVGDDGELVLRLDIDSTVPTEGSPDLYEAYNLMAEARLEMGGVLIAPKDNIYTALSPGRPVTFTWHVRPASKGLNEGTIWLHLEYVPHPDPLEPVYNSRRLAAAPKIKLQSVNLFGLAGIPARVIGGVCTALGAVLLMTPLISRWVVSMNMQTGSSGIPPPAA